MTQQQQAILDAHLAERNNRAESWANDIDLALARVASNALFDRIEFVEATENNPCPRLRIDAYMDLDDQAQLASDLRDLLAAVRKTL